MKKNKNCGEKLIFKDKTAEKDIKDSTTLIELLRKRSENDNAQEEDNGQENPESLLGPQLLQIQSLLDKKFKKINEKLTELEKRILNLID